MQKRFFLIISLFLIAIVLFGQERPKISRFINADPTSVRLGAEGGERHIKISSSGSWEILEYPATWGRLTKKEDGVSIKVDENTGTSSRSCSFVLGKNDNKVRVSVEQAGATSLSVSSERIKFVSAGEIKTINVSTNGTWQIGANTVNWAHLTKTGNKLNIRADKNNSTAQRYGKVSVISGKKEIIINISQSGKAVTQFTVSSEDLQFNSTEETKTIEVSSVGSWQVVTYPASWGHISRKDNLLEIRVDSNPSSDTRWDWFAIKSGDIVKRIDISQNGKSGELSLSAENLMFNSQGGTQTISISTDDSWYIGTAVASWGHLSKNGNDLIIEVEPNKSTDSRKDWFSVKTRSEEKIIKISQEGVSSYLTVSSDKLNFNSLGGTQNISVNSNRDWDISLKTAPWGHLYRNGNVLTVSVDKNENKTQRSDCFKLKADETEVQVNISQEGYSSQEPNSKRSFNQAYDNDDWGISVGYIQKQWEYNLAGNIWKTGPFNDDNKLRGIQAGVRYAPQFWYGIGINTGLFYEYCWEANWITYVNSKSYNRSYKEHGIYIPLHLKYTMNFSEWLQFSLFGGLGLNYVISGKAYLKNDKEYRTWDVFYEDRDWHRLNFMLEYGASIKVKSFQIDISRSKGITNWAGIKDYRLKVGRPLSVSLTYFF